MSATKFEGVIENGQVKLLDGVRLPENAKVYVILPDPEIPSRPRVRSPHLARSAEAGDFKKVVIKAAGDAEL